MTVAGWIFMIASWGAILALGAFCFSQVLKPKGSDHLVAPLEIDTEPTEPRNRKPSGGRAAR